MISVKRRIIVPLAGVILVGIILLGIFSSDPRAPRFVPMRTQPSGPFRNMYCGWVQLAAPKTFGVKGEVLMRAEREFGFYENESCAKPMIASAKIFN
jgi:hypothetical protein